MGMTRDYEEHEPTREDVGATRGPVLLEFGNAWCGHCRAAQPLIEHALAGHEDVRHLKIADGPGRRLGRSFTVKLWPTLVFLRDGEELARLVRPQDGAQIAQALAKIDPPGKEAST